MSDTSTKPEPWVKAEVVAEHLSVCKDQVNKLARLGLLPAKNVGVGMRRSWRFRISEVDAAVISGKG